MPPETGHAHEVIQNKAVDVLGFILIKEFKEYQMIR